MPNEQKNVKEAAAFLTGLYAANLLWVCDPLVYIVLGIECLQWIRSKAQKQRHGQSDYLSGKSTEDHFFDRYKTSHSTLGSAAGRMS